MELDPSCRCYGVRPSVLGKVRPTGTSRAGQLEGKALAGNIPAIDGLGTGQQSSTMWIR